MFLKKIKKFYKRFIYILFTIFYGKINSIIYPNNSDEIFEEELNVNGCKYKLFKCNRVRLYTDTIQDTSIIKNNKLVDGPSFQYRNNKNEKNELNSVFFKGTPKIKKKIKGSVFSLLVGGGGNSNYWHWLFDVIPKFYIYQSSKFFDPNSYILLPSLDRDFQNETLDLLGIKRKFRISSKYYRHFEADKIVTTSHPYNFLNDPDKDSLNIPSWIFSFLKKSFLIEKIIDSNYIKKFPKKIYISRKDGTSLRYLINEKEVKDVLKKNDFQEIILSQYSFADQVSMFYNADFIAGLHGAGFANIVFCRSGTNVLEFRSDTAGDVIRNMAVKNNLFYKDIIVKPKTINYNDQSGDLLINISNLEKKLKINSI